jgi:RNA 2',3'-cyclic 3'-phosphodiesterase
VRLFVAVWPPDDVIALIEGILRPEVPGLRWTTRPQWHVTMSFLGEVEQADEVVDALADLSGSGMEQAVLGPATAWFPGRRVLQVPVTGLDHLAGRVVEAIAHVDNGRFAARVPESGRFNGHLTLARVRGSTRIGGGEARRLAGAPLSAEWVVGSVSLVASTLHPEGARYSDVTRVELGA